MLKNKGLILRYCLLALLFCFAGVPAAVLLAQDADNQEAEKAQDQAEQPTEMNNQRLGELLAKRFENIEGREGFWIIKIAAEQAEDAGEAEADERDPLDDSDEPKDDEEDQRAEELTLMVVTDERANRMRIMTPIRKFDPMDEDDVKLSVLLLHANFDRALDAKYAINGGMLWSCFVHPLGSLTESDLDNALIQVQTLHKNTGTTYSSTDMIFGGGQQPPEEENPRGPEI